MINIRDKASGLRLESLIESDRSWFFEVATNSLGSAYWYGPITGFDPPSKIQFDKDFQATYFDEKRIMEGQCFAIVLNSKRLGVIIYHKIVEQKAIYITDLDILISDQQDLNKGYGSKAIEMLCTYLFENNFVHQIQLEVPVDNVRAYYAYKKANFSDVKRIAKAGKVWMKMKRNP